MNCPAGMNWLCHDLPGGMNCARRRIVIGQFKSYRVSDLSWGKAPIHDTSCQIILVPLGAIWAARLFKHDSLGLTKTRKQI